MAGNLPVAFGELLVGGLLIAHGASAVSKATQSAGGSSSVLSGSTPAAVSTGQRQGAVTMGDLQAIGAKFGWSGSELDAWWKVISAESGGDPTSTNPSSGAYGIGQFLGATKAEYAKYGATSSDPMHQLQAMAQYIKDRYGTPSAAWGHEQSAHWY